MENYEQLVKLEKEDGGEFAVFYETGGRKVPYEIDITNITTSKQVLDWIEHISRKSWITVDHFRQFIDLTKPKLAKTI